MKKVSYFIALLLAVICTNVNAQIVLKTEYYGMSNYQDDNHNNVGKSKGSAIVYQGMINMPFSVKMNEKNQPTMWGLGLGGSYVSLNNKNFTADLVLDEIMNLQLGVMHIRPLGEKWSMMASVGVGIFAPNTRFSKINLNNVMGNAGVIFIRHLNPNLSVGCGLAINNTFGYPMLFPSLYFDWTYEGRFLLKVSMMDGGKVSTGYNASKSLTLSLFAEMDGQGAFLEKEGKNMIFTHQSTEIGFRSEIKLGKGICIPLSVGGSMRQAYYSERHLKSIFNGKSGGFDIAPTISIGIKYGIK